MTPGTASENAPEAGQAGGFAGFADPQKRGTCPESEAGVWLLGAGDSAGAGPAPRVDASMSRFPEGDVGFADFADATKSAVCPECGADLEVYRGTNRFKVGTGWCAPCGRRVRLHREPVRTALRAVSQARAAGAELRALLGG
jgi:hypothetical protein